MNKNVLMNNFFLLIRYEWKKLWSKRIVQVSLVVIFVLQCYSNLVFLTNSEVTYYSDYSGNNHLMESMTGYEIMAADKENAKALDGRVIDQKLLTEMNVSYIESVGKICKPYDAVTIPVRNIMGPYRLSDSTNLVTEEEFYRKWKSNIYSQYQSDFLRKDEVEHWEAVMEEIQIPFVFRYHTAWEKMLETALTISIFVLTGLAICLSTVFSDEHRRKTDQLVLCTKNGRVQVYMAKLTVGILVGVVFTLLLYLVSFAIVFAFWGTDGFSEVIQLVVPQVPYDLSVGQGVFILIGITVLAAVLESVFALFLSEKAGNGVAVMAIMVGGMILTQFVEIPKQFRVISQMYSYIPTFLIAQWNFSDTRMIKAVGQYFTNFQFAAILYPVMTAILIFWGYHNYKKYEISGR